MNRIDRALSDIRPALRKVAPQTFWFSLIFGVFNIAVGYGLASTSILVRLKVLGLIPVKGWGLIFIIHGAFILYSLLINDWKLSRNLNIVGAALKTSWWLELFAVFISTGGFPFTLMMWTVLLSFQVIIVIYFTPKADL